MSQGVRHKIITKVIRKERKKKRGEVFNFRQEKARSFNTVVVNTPPLSSILKPPNQGYVDKKKKPKPIKPNKEEGSSEEVDEDQEDESSSQMHSSGSESVAISPPPDGASVAEAKPIGLAIAGPGGVAASKPQGTAVVGPGGLAIARPVGTAIAGVPVEGTVPIGGPNKNKKKPKQEQEQPDGELHYVGGLTGPIGNPQPKEFIEGVNFRFLKTADGKNYEEKSFVRESPTGEGLQFKLGLKDNKYGIIPVSSSLDKENNFQKKIDSPVYSHGLLGNNAEDLELLQNYRFQYQ